MIMLAEKTVEDLVKRELDREKDRIRRIVACANPQLTEEGYRQILLQEVMNKVGHMILFHELDEVLSNVQTTLRRALMRDEWIYVNKGGGENGS